MTKLTFTLPPVDNSNIQLASKATKKGAKRARKPRAPPQKKPPALNSVIKEARGVGTKLKATTSTTSKSANQSLNNSIQSIRGGGGGDQ